MANWSGGILTAKGRALQAKVEAGTTLELVKMKLGSGNPSGDELDNLNDLTQPKYVMGISAKEVNKNLCKVTSILTSTTITEGFYAREWGLFVNDPDEGEILYMVTTDPNPDFVPPSTAALKLSASYALNVAVLNANGVNVIIDPAGLVTTSILATELEKYLQKTGGEVTGLINLASNLVTNLTTNIPLNDNSGKLVPTAWVQAFVKELSANVEVTTQDDGHFVCSSLGISGMIAQNGYISLGKLFGGLIIQWGLAPSSNYEETYILPISFKQKAYSALACDIGAGAYRAGAFARTLNTITIFQTISAPPARNISYGYFVLGI